MTTSKQPLPTDLARHIHLRHPSHGETTLFLIRHGRTDSNVRRVLQGQMDTPLDSFGVQQAHRVAQRVADEIEADLLLSSPLQRALVTAQIVGKGLGMEPVIMPELSEMDFGAFEGQTVARIEAEHPEIAAGMNDVLNDDFGWPGGESRRDFHGRVLRAFQSILADNPGRRVIVVAHGGVIGSFMAQVLGMSPNDWWSNPILNCSLTHLHVTPDHTVVHLVNDAVHLELLDPNSVAAREGDE